MRFERKSGNKLQLKCKQCGEPCLPKNGEWHDVESGQSFFCKSCRPPGQAKKNAAARKAKASSGT